MNAVLAYSLALLLAGGGPAATGVVAAKQAKYAAVAGLPTPNATAPKPDGKPASGATTRAATPATAATGTVTPGTVTPPATGLPNGAGVGGARMPPPAASPRPAWVDEPDGVRERGVYVMHVYVGPELSRTECEPKLAREIERRLGQYVGEIMPAGEPVAVPYDVARLRSRVVAQEWEERIHGETADLVYLHVQLRIDEKLRQEWKAEAIAATRAERSRIVMFGYAAAVVAAIGAFVLLKWSGRRASAAAGLLPAAAVVGIICGVAALFSLLFVA